jgi:HEAT repeat protein
MKNLFAVLQAEAAKDSIALREALTDAEEGEVPVSVLSRLLLEEWHDVQEDIVFQLSLIGDASAIPAILEAAKTPFAELGQWGNLQEFRRKCAYALARIGTDESRVALLEMASNSEADLRECGEEGLRHWPMPYRSE